MNEIPFVSVVPVYTGAAKGTHETWEEVRGDPAVAYIADADLGPSDSV